MKKFIKILILTLWLPVIGQQTPASTNIAPNDKTQVPHCAVHRNTKAVQRTKPSPMQQFSTQYESCTL